MVGRVVPNAPNSQLAEERARLLGVASENLGKQLGWGDEDIRECADMLQAISEATSKGVQR